MKSAEFIHELVTKMTLEQQKIKLLDDEQLLPIKQKPNLDQIKNKENIQMLQILCKTPAAIFKIQIPANTKSKFNTPP